MLKQLQKTSVRHFKERVGGVKTVNSQKPKQDQKSVNKNIDQLLKERARKILL